MKTQLFFFAVLASLTIAPAHAVILYGAENSANLTNPGTGLPFDTVGRVSSAAGIEDGGSGVHLGGGYMITAAHILQSQINTVTFDSSTFHSRDMSFTPVQIGSTDLRIFKLSSTPTVGAAQLYDGSAELLNDASLVGFGSGRKIGESINTNVVELAPGGSPLLKRWGMNQPVSEVSAFSYTRNSETYTFDAIQTVLGNTQGNPNDDGNGAFEAAAGPRDSGSGMFQLIDSAWYLTGITSVIFQQNANSITFGNDVPAVIGAGSAAIPPDAGDPNLFVQISSYSTQINTLVPEPSHSLLALSSLVLLLRRRR